MDITSKQLLVGKLAPFGVDHRHAVHYMHRHAVQYMHRHAVQFILSLHLVGGSELILVLLPAAIPKSQIRMYIMGTE